MAMDLSRATRFVNLRLVFNLASVRHYSKLPCPKAAFRQSSFSVSRCLLPASVVRFKQEFKACGDPSHNLTCKSLMSQIPYATNAFAGGFSVALVLSLLRLFEETARRRIFDPTMNRKLVHISIGLCFVLCWPLFSADRAGAILASLIPGVQALKMLLIGLGLWKDDATVKSMSRSGNPRELLSGPLCYGATLTYACVAYWRTSPIAIAVVSNLCAGDGLADIIGRRFGKMRIPYNKNKTVAGSVAMAAGGFAASVGLMYYLASFGYIPANGTMVIKFFMVSLASTVVESLPLGWMDDNLSIPLTSMLVGSMVF